MNLASHPAVQASHLPNASLTPHPMAPRCLLALLTHARANCLRPLTELCLEWQAPTRCIFCAWLLAENFALCRETRVVFGGARALLGMRNLGESDVNETDGCTGVQEEHAPYVVLHRHCHSSVHCGVPHLPSMPLSASTSLTHHQSHLRSNATIKGV